MLAEAMNILPSEMIFAGDEPKDMECAVNAGAVAVLVNRSGEEKDYGQDFMIRSFRELPDLLC